MSEIKKMILITDCITECPKAGMCIAWKKITPKQRFTITTGIGIGKFILKGCPLDDYQENINELPVKFEEVK